MASCPLLTSGLQPVLSTFHMPLDIILWLCPHHLSRMPPPLANSPVFPRLQAACRPSNLSAARGKLPLALREQPGSAAWGWLSDLQVCSFCHSSSPSPSPEGAFKTAREQQLGRAHPRHRRSCQRLGSPFVDTAPPVGRRGEGRSRQCVSSTPCPTRSLQMSGGGLASPRCCRLCARLHQAVARQSPGLSAAAGVAVAGGLAASSVPCLAPLPTGSCAPMAQVIPTKAEVGGGLLTGVQVL